MAKKEKTEWTREEENELAIWCEEQRRNRKNLTKKQVAFLESIPGWYWDEDKITVPVGKAN